MFCDQGSLGINLHAEQSRCCSGGGGGPWAASYWSSHPVVVVHSLSQVQLFVTPWIAARQAGFPVLHHLPELAQTQGH